MDSALATEQKVYYPGKKQSVQKNLDMPPSRNITDFFKRPSFAFTTPETPPNKKRDSVNAGDSPAATSPLTEPSSSSFFSNRASSLPSSQIEQSQSHPVKQEAGDGGGKTVQSAENPSQQTSFASQRVVRDGKEVVISSDGDDTDSIASLESPEDLLAKLAPPVPKDIPDKKEKTEDKPETKDVLRTRRAKGDRSKSSASRFSMPHYKNTIESLVTDAVDDNETEASIARLRLTFNKAEESAADPNSDGQGKQLHEGMLASALGGDNDDGPGLQRVLDAIRRTEAFDRERTWSFFSDKAIPPPGPEFPRDSVTPGTYMDALREPDSRERAFHSGIVDFALSRKFLPDELVTWIFHSVAAESRDGLRRAYCRVFKHATAERINSLIRPNDIDMLFQRLRASPKALACTQTIIPDPPDSVPLQAPTDQAALLCVLGLFREAADLFADDTRERILIILFRLTLDILLMKNTTICSNLERTITSVLEGIPDDSADEVLHRICSSLYNTIQDSAFQSRLLKHTIPTSTRIALIRCRLAVAYLIHHPSPLTEPPETVLNVNRILHVLRDKRFEVKLYKGKGAEYDYGELGAIVTLLNIAIDSGWTGSGFPNKDDEKAFNAEIDVLAERIKKIFTSIEDSGVSHLKRTLAKEGLEALHYRILYSIRSKPPPKKTLFKAYGKDNHDTHDNQLITGWVRTRKGKQDTEKPTEKKDPS